MTTDEYVGERVMTVMWRRRIPQQRIADTLGVSQPTVGRKLRGERRWTLDELMAVAESLQLPVEDLLPPQPWCAVRDSNPEPADKRRGHGMGEIVELSDHRARRLRPIRHIRDDAA